MKLVYEFATGSETIEVDEKWIAIVNEMDRVESNLDRKERYHCYSLDLGEEIGCQYECKSNIDEMFDEPSIEERLIIAISKLKPRQKEIIKSIYFDGLSQEEYAIKKGLTQGTVSSNLKTAKKNLKKFL